MLKGINWNLLLVRPQIYGFAQTFINVFDFSVTLLWITLYLIRTRLVSRFRPPFVEDTFKELCVAREKLVKSCQEAWSQFLE